MSLSLDEVRRIARLARLSVNEAEAGAVAERLNAVLALIGQIQALDTAGTEPMAHPLDAQLALRQPLRPDAATEADRRADYQAVAPAVEQGLYLVPRVIE